MTSEEIVKSLRHCAIVDGSVCYACPARDSALKSELNCNVLMKTEAADLIERLEKEKAALLKALRACSWVCRTFPDHAPATGFATSALHDYVQTAFSEMVGSGKDWRTHERRIKL